MNNVQKSLEHRSQECINVNIVHGNVEHPMIDPIPAPPHILKETASLRHDFGALVREICRKRVRTAVRWCGLADLPVIDRAFALQADVPQQCTVPQSTTPNS